VVFLLFNFKTLYVRIHSKFHSGWAYLALLLLVVVVINSVFGLVGKKDFTAKIENCALWTDRYTHTIIDWINIVFCFSAWFCFSWTNV
jgi:hypothetical protein